MKKILPFLLFILSTSTFSLYSINESKSELIMDDSSGSQIILEGDLIAGSIRSRSTIKALSAELQNDVIWVTFNYNVGNVEVSIIDDSGNTVYSSVLNSDSGSASISISSLSVGIYTITFSNGTGSMWGDFEK